jgi:glycerol-3-phosphate O-acyltransferase 3/4
MVTTAQVFAILGILSAPMISIAALVLTLAALNLSLGLRRLFVRVLAFIFDYATKIKKVKEVPITPNTSSDEPPTPSPTTEAPPIVKRSSSDPIEVTSPTPLISQPKSNETTDQDQKVSTSDIQFKLGNPENSLRVRKRIFVFSEGIVDYTRQGLEAIVDDEVTKRFTSAEEMAVWNLLTRTQQQHEHFSIRITLLWFLGFCVRYFILFPFRLCLFILAIFWMLCSAIVVKYFPIADAKLRYGFYINIVLHRILSRVFSAIITYHNTEYRATRGSICVANHTSPIDVIILSTDNSFSMIGQAHGGFFGMVQRTLSQTAEHIWFERSEAKDRHMVAEKMREHIKKHNNLPILIFPEGTCINNTSVMMFKKGCFEITDAPIYPVAIKYDNRFGDAFWNSSKHDLFQYLILMMTSWAIVVDVYYLPPMTIEENETSIDFARRVKAAIAKQGGFVDLEWDGGLKRALPKADFKAEEQRKFYETLKTE